MGRQGTPWKELCLNSYEPHQGRQESACGKVGYAPKTAPERTDLTLWRSGAQAESTSSG